VCEIYVSFKFAFLSKEIGMMSEETYGNRLGSRGIHPSAQLSCVSTKSHRNNKPNLV
jgi:hypothetical protein